MNLDIGDDIYIWNKISDPIPMEKATYLGDLYQDGRNLYLWNDIHLDLPENYFDKHGNSSVGYYDTSSDSCLDWRQHIWVADNYPKLTQKQLNLIYSEAYDRGHSCGESEVNSYFKDICAFVDSVIKLA